MKEGLVQISDWQWEMPKHGQMRVPAWFFADKGLMCEMDHKVFEQLHNVACLPGIVQAAMAMPDAHWGYGFPIGGVAAFDADAGGVISVGGVGYDISCGVRCFTTGLAREEIAKGLASLMEDLFRTIPAGVGSEGKIRLTPDKLDEVLVGGAHWAVEKGYGFKEELKYIEEHGCMSSADPSCVSAMAKERQYRQVGTLGSGNHYLEIQYIDEIYCEDTAKAFGLEKDAVIISIHCGSRALGHQIGTDYIQILGRASKKYSIPIRERELVCAPILSPEGERYFKAMACGVNCALANRQVLGHLVREVFERHFPRASLKLIYDVSHNTCKVEHHEVNGVQRLLYVHRKGATRAFGPGRLELPDAYRAVGQPVFIGGTMGTCSYILAGTQRGEGLAWGSACHGAGRAMSRNTALKRWKGRDVVASLAVRGILVKAVSWQGAAEEAPGAYKDVTVVVNAAHNAGLVKKVAKVLPMACLKG